MYDQDPINKGTTSLILVYQIQHNLKCKLIAWGYEYLSWTTKKPIIIWRLAVLPLCGRHLPREHPQNLTKKGLLIFKMKLQDQVCLYQAG